MDAISRIRVSAAAVCAVVVILPSSAFPQRTLSVAPATAAQQSAVRVALLIGNAGYDADARLKNPVNDASDLAEVLRSMDFQVKLVTDADQQRMQEAIDEFHQSLRRGGVGLFYFAGHGIMSKDGKNYLIPTKASIKREMDLKFRAIDANYVLAGMEDSGSQFNIVILDACRNNPFTRAWRSSAQGGLAQMSAPKGSFIAFATSPGMTAADGDERNGVFTKHLLANLRQGESAIDRIFIRVSAGVTTETGDVQVPWQSSNLTGVFRFRHDEPVAAVGQIDPAEQAQWNAIRTSTDPRDFDKFLAIYPNGYYGSQARDYKTKLINDLKAEQERQKRFEEERRQQQARMEEERRQQQARMEQERRLEQARMEEERRRVREQDIRLQESRARQEELERQKAEMEKNRRRVYVPPTF